MIFGIIYFLFYFEPYNVFLAIATNKPQRLKTGFVLQGHIYILFLISTIHLFYIYVLTCHENNVTILYIL